MKINENKINTLFKELTKLHKKARIKYYEYGLFFLYLDDTIIGWLNLNDENHLTVTNSRLWTSDMGQKYNILTLSDEDKNKIISKFKKEIHFLETLNSLAKKWE